MDFVKFFMKEDWVNYQRDGVAWGVGTGSGFGQILSSFWGWIEKWPYLLTDTAKFLITRYCLYTYDFLAITKSVGLGSASAGIEQRKLIFARVFKP